MDEESSTKFIGSLTKFLQSLCNGYVEFEDGVELIGHIYLSVDSGKTAKKLNYFLNEKVCKNDNSVTFISNSFHAQPESKAKAASGKDSEGKKDEDNNEPGNSVPRSTNAGTIPSRTPLSSRSATSPGLQRSGIGTKRSGSPLSAPTPPSQRRMQSSVKSSVGSPASKTVPSSPSSSSQDNIPSPSPARRNRSEISQPPSNQSDNVSVDNENDLNVPVINPPADFASFIGSLTSDNPRDQRSPPDMKPDTDVTFIKEEFVPEPSCGQSGSSGQSGRSGDDLYPVMMHQNTSVFPTTSSSYPSSTATSQHPGYPGASTSQSDPFNPQDGADPSGAFASSYPCEQKGRKENAHSLGPLPRINVEREMSDSNAYWSPEPVDVDLTTSDEAGDWEGPREGVYTCPVCSKSFTQLGSLNRHFKLHSGGCAFTCSVCGSGYTRNDNLIRHMRTVHGMFEERLRAPKCPVQSESDDMPHVSVSFLSHSLH